MKLSFEFVDPTTGENDLCPIIFLHAIFDSRKTWGLVAPQISNETRRRVYSVDARNHGDSPSTEDFTIQIMADDIKEFLNEHKIAKAILVGNGIGGVVAMKLALEVPGLIEKLVVESMVPEPFPPQGWALFLDMIVELKLIIGQIPEGSNILDAKRTISNYIALRFDLKEPDQTDEYALNSQLKEENGTFKWEANLDAIEVALRTNEDFDGELIGTYGGEALFLYGEESGMEVADDERIPFLFPRALCVAVEEAAYMTHHDMPQEFVEHVTQFINSQSNLNPSSIRAES